MAATKEEKETTVAKETSSIHSTKETKFELTEELAYLTSHFQGQCKVIDSTGKYVKTIKLHPEDLDISVPVTEIRSESLDEDEIDDLQAFLKQTAKGMAPLSLEGLLQKALEWLKKEQIDVTGKRVKSKRPEGAEGTSKGRQRKRRKPKDPETKGKKPPMKTAIDVVKRILWDEALQQDQFLVGYLDRIDGLKEKYFNAFSWEDIASVDYTVLAIPKHRIQYFKYKNEIVWDKRCRLDNVFGSTGSKKTIVDVISGIDGVQVRNEAHENDQRNDMAEADPDSDYYDSADYSESDSDSDDGITVTIDNSERGAIGGRDSEEDFDVDNNVDDEDGNDDQYNKYWRDKLRPNHFIALRITDDDVRNAADEIQKHVIANEPKLKDCKIPTGALHLTLCTIGLETPEQVLQAVKCLEESLPELASIVPKDKKLTFKGVQTFFNRVIYGKVIDCPPEFHDLVQHLKTCLASEGIEVRDYHEFVPHMTIMKVSRPVAKLTGNNYIAPWLYSTFNETVLGSQSIDNLHLCTMADERQPDGFYISPASFKL